MRRVWERGFSLVEVILALGLLAMVLLSISGLFVLGGRQVKSGRQSTQALSVARAIVEEMEGWSFRQTYERYGFDGSQTAYVVDTRTNGYARKWQDALDGALAGAWATIELVSLGNPPQPLSATAAIRVLVTVHWEETGRQRQLRLGMVRL